MRVVVVYRDDSEHGRAVTDFLHDFHRQTGRTLETFSPDTPEGMGFCDTYDIVEYPTLVALSEGGELQTMWRGVPLPTISEVSYYA